MRPGSVRRLSWAVFFATLAVLAMVLPVYWVYLLTTVAISAILARGVGVVTNLAGLLLLCQMSFAALGGWVVSWIALQWATAPFVLLVVIGGVAVAPVGWLLGFMTSRIRGVEFAVVTLGFAAALDLVLKQGSFPGVGSGTPVVIAEPFNEPVWFFALSWALLLALQLLVTRLGRSRVGLAWPMLRQSERAAAALGVRVSLAKASALSIAAGMAAVAGGLLAGQYGLLTPQVFSPLTSLVVLATAVLTGASLLSGTILAGVFAVFVPEVLRRVGVPIDVGNALLALGAVDVLRRGTGGIAEQLHANMQDRSFRGQRVTCELVGSAVAGSAFAGLGGAGASVAGSPVATIEQTSRKLFAQPRFEVRDLSVMVGERRLLDGVSVQVQSATVHALVGANGAGKTTLIDAVSGFLPRAEGQVWLNGQCVDGLSVDRRARLGLRRSFQRSRVPQSLTVGEYLRLASGGSGDAAMREASEHFGLPHGQVPIRLLDSTSRRLLEIAGTVAALPSVVLLDEPASGCSEAERPLLAERLRQVPDRFGCAVLMVEHDMRLVREVAEMTTVLNDGRVIASGATAAVLQDPAVVAAYLGRKESS